MAETTFDKRSGAPLNIRAIVGSFDTKEKKLEALRKYFPDAESTDNTILGDGNFIYTNPETKMPTLFNETEGGLLGTGLSAGDVIEYGREMSNVVGGMLGGAVATVAGQTGPQVFTPEEVVTVPAGAALGSEMAGQLYDGIMGLLLPEPVSRGTLIEQGSKAAQNVMGEMIAGKLVQGGLNKVSEKGGNIIRNILGVGAKRQKESKQLLETASSVGINMPTAGTATQSPFLMFMEQRLGQMPTGAPVFAQQFDVFKKNIVEAVDDAAKKYGDPKPEGGQIGQVIKEGADKAKSNFIVTQRKLYNDAFDLVPNARGSLDNVKQLEIELNAKLADAPKFYKKEMAEALEKIKALTEQPDISLDSLREVRTVIRLLIDPSGGGMDVSKPSARYLKQVYDSLSKDMFAIVRNAGDEKAVKALKKADAYTLNRKQNDINPIIEKIIKFDTDVKAFNFLMQGTKESSDQLNKILRNMPAEERKIIQGSMLSRLGYQKPSGAIDEDFSTRTFLTNWSKLADSSKDVLFGKNNEARENLDKIVDVFRNINNADAYANPSQTGQMLGTIMTYAPLLPSGAMFMSGDPITIAGAGATALSGIVPPHYASKLVTNEKFINWLAKAGPEMANNPNSVKFHIGRLMEIFSGDEPLTQAAYSYIEALGPSILGEAQAKEVATIPEGPNIIADLAKDIKPNVAEKIMSISGIN